MLFPILNKKKRVLLLTSYLSDRGSLSKTDKLIIAAFKKKGVEVLPVNPKKIEYFLDRKGFKVLYEDQDLTRFNLLLVRRTRYLEKESYILASYLAKKGIKVIDEPGSLLYPTTKHLLQSDFLTRVKLPPKSLFTGNISEVNPDDYGINYPFIIKPQTGTEGHGVVLVRTAEEFKKYQKQNLDKSLIVQEYIPIKHEYRVLTVGGRSIGSCLKDTQSIVKNAAQGSVFRFVSVPKVEKFAVKMAKLHKGQIFGVDVAESENGQLYILECNRNPNFTAFRKASGIKVEEKIVDYCLQRL